MPERCAPTTATAISPSAARGAIAASGGCAAPVAPSGSAVSAWNARPSDASAASQRARGEVALGDPGSLVAEPRGWIERLDVDRAEDGAEPLQARERCVVGRGRGLIAEEQPLPRHGHAEAHAARQRAKRAQPARAR